MRYEKRKSYQFWKFFETKILVSFSPLCLYLSYGISEKRALSTSSHLVWDVLPLLGAVGPGAAPLGVVAPRVPDPHQGKEALLATSVDLGTDNLEITVL